ncbi:MAG: PKD domain-containing protein [Rhodoluna sp.]|nr:PKD domain-containing protein [Rhodoluna sp.]
MKPQLKINSFVGFGLMISLLVFAPEPSFAACRNSGGSSGNNSVGSQVNGSSVTICASALAVVPARTSVVKSKVVVKAKPTPAKAPAVFRRTQAPLQPKVMAPISKPKPKVLIAPAAKPKVAAQTKVVSNLVTAPGSASKSSATADFSPAAVSANVYPSDQLVVGQTASFSSSALQHFKSGTLLNLPTEVRFTPISVDWDFQGEGETQASAGRGSYVNHVFSSAGLFQVQVMATYAVSYRLRGSLDWIAEPETISMVDELLIYVSGDGAEQTDVPAITAPERQVRLVSGDCLKRPGSFGCH